MLDLDQYGISKEWNPQEEIVYCTALMYNKVSSSIANYLKDYNLTVGKFNILFALKNHGGIDGIKQVEVSKHLIVTPSNMTKMIDKLEKEGMVTRSALEGDRRVNIVKITEKALDLLKNIWDGYNEVIQNSVKDLTISQQKQLAGLLKNWFSKA
ncbi:hypothetical protein MNBD_UNCLBAC01-96 [hydrothermal vent metagenome]|uniref:HTH marR-type domain-containing protein n=1 Tax=hydrothermal vent metagenome TaxID=652676 RepID=A0A3B1D241_9ZZZZ